MKVLLNQDRGSGFKAIFIVNNSILKGVPPT